MPHGAQTRLRPIRERHVSCVLALPLLLGCAGGSAQADADGAISANDSGMNSGVAFRPGAPPGFPPGLDALAPLPNPYGDGGCTLQASNSEGDCISNEDCLGGGGMLSCINGKCPPFCDTFHFTDVQDPPDGSVRCARLSGPVNADASYVGSARWCVPPQTCTPYDGQWGCCMSTGTSSVFCVSAFDEGGAN